MPSSFSRFLSEEEMQRVRELYLKSLEEAGADATEPPAATPGTGTTSPGAHPDGPAPHPGAAGNREGSA